MLSAGLDSEQHDARSVLFIYDAHHEGYSGGGLEGIECECYDDDLLKCFQGSPVECVEDSPGLDVGDGPLFRPGGSG